MTYKTLLLGLVFSSGAIAQDNPVVATLLLKQGSSWDGTALHYPEGVPDVSSSLIEIAQGAQTGWHRHPVPIFAYILEGELELELKDGTRKQVRAGESVIETVNTWHNGVNVGDSSVKLVAFFMGVAGRPLTEMEQPPK